MIDTQIVKLQTGREVTKGLVPSTRAELAKAFYVFAQQHKFHALPPPPDTIVNSLGVILDPYGNSNFASADKSYKGRPVGDCTLASITTMLVTLSQSTNFGGGQLNFEAATVVNWWRRYNPQCSIQNALDVMRTTPIMDASGRAFLLGPNGTIDYTNVNEVKQALYLFKAIDNGLDSSPLDRNVGDADGWVVADVTRQIGNYDHSTPTLDIGEAGELFDAKKIKLPTNKISATDLGIGMSTWGVWGFVEMQSYMNMNGEAHVVLTSTARGDSAEWNAIASEDFADLAKPWGPPVTPVNPVGPAPLPDPNL